MKLRSFILLFSCLTLLHLAAQFAFLYASLYTLTPGESSYDAAAFERAQSYGHIGEIIALPGSRIFGSHPSGAPPLGRVQIFAVFALNSVLWATVITVTFYLVFRLFRSRPPQSPNHALQRTASGRSAPDGSR